MILNKKEDIYLNCELVILEFLKLLFCLIKKDDKQNYMLYHLFYLVVSGVTATLNDSKSHPIIS